MLIRNCMVIKAIKQRAINVSSLSYAIHGPIHLFAQAIENFHRRTFCLSFHTHIRRSGKKIYMVAFNNGMADGIKKGTNNKMPFFMLPFKDGLSDANIWCGQEKTLFAVSIYIVESCLFNLFRSKLTRKKVKRRFSMTLTHLPVFFSLRRLITDSRSLFACLHTYNMLCKQNENSHFYLCSNSKSIQLFFMTQRSFYFCNCEKCICTNTWLWHQIACSAVLK